MRAFPLLCILLTGFASGACDASSLKSDEEIIYFPTNAAWSAQDDVWRIPIHGWVFEAERDSLLRNGALALLKQQLELDPKSNHSQHLRERGWSFIVDNERNKNITLRIAEREFPLTPSQANGHLYGEAVLSGSHAMTENAPAWIPIDTVMPQGDQRRFSGTVQLIPEKGLSVISDIDDTIKVSNVLDKRALMENTFMRDFEAVPNMASLYRHWQNQGAAFHYVTGSPWQLYPALSEFINQHHFPRGSFDMRNFRIKDASLFDFLGTSYGFKINTIAKLMQRYPQRQFILVGDSGELDPEVYGEIARRYPNQIKAIYIHNVTATKQATERYQKAFAALPANLWQNFIDVQQLQLSVDKP